MKLLIFMICIFLVGCTKPDIKPDVNLKAMIDREKTLDVVNK